MSEHQKEQFEAELSPEDRSSPRGWLEINIEIGFEGDGDAALAGLRGVFPKEMIKQFKVLKGDDSE